MRNPAEAGRASATGCTAQNSPPINHTQASAPWMKFWPADFMLETQHLSPAEIGHHVRLICLAWRRMNCAIPNDATWIKRRLGVGEDDYHRDVVPVLDEFWPDEGEDRVNHNLRLAYAEVVSKSEKTRKAAYTRHYGRPKEETIDENLARRGIRDVTNDPPLKANENPDASAMHKQCHVEVEADVDADTHAEEEKPAMKKEPTRTRAREAEPAVPHDADAFNPDNWR